MRKPLGFNNIKDLRDLIEIKIKKSIEKYSDKKDKTDFVNADILVKAVDYYYTNSIARSSKVMSECRQITKKFLYTGIEKASYCFI